MKKILITGIVIIIILVLGIGFLTALCYDVSKNENDNSYNLENYIHNTKVQENNQGNSCEDATDSYPCFQYKNLEQEINSGKNYRPEQTRLEPCQPAPPKCELCFDSLEQTIGEGKSNIPEQTRKKC